MGSSHSQGLSAGELLVGWSEQSITPEKPVKLQGQFHERVSEYVQSEIVVTVLALETRDACGTPIDQLMIGACDLCSIPGSLLLDVREKLSARLDDFCVDKLVINATHTHTAPIKTKEEAAVGSYIYERVPAEMRPHRKPENPEIMQPDEYSAFLSERLCEAFTAAWHSRQPGFVNWQLAQAVVGHSRRVVYDDASAQMYGTSDTFNFECLEGPVDHGIELLFFWSESDLSGVAVNVACPSQVVESHNFISADYWGEVRKQLRDRFGDQVFTLPLCGAAGDQSPRDMIRRGRGEPSMHHIEGAVELATRITNAVTEKYQAALQEKQAQVELVHRVLNVDLPIRTVSRQENESAWAEFDAILATKQPGEKLDTSDIVRLFSPAGIMSRYEFQQETSFYSPEIHAIRLGQVGIVTNPFELFTEYGLKIKARSRALQTFIVQLACDSGGYLPTKRAVNGGGYSAIVASGRVGPEGGRVLVEQTVRVINELFD